MSTATTATPAIADPTMPTVARVSRVESILTGEPAFKGKLGAKSETLSKRDGTKVKFALGVVQVAKAIHAEGKDAVALGKNDILKIAMKVLGVGDGNTVAPGAEAPAAEAPAETSESSAPVAEAETSEAPAEAPAGDAKTKPSINQNISVVALLVSALQIAEVDSKPGAESRRKKLNDLLQEYNQVIG